MAVLLVAVVGLLVPAVVRLAPSRHRVTVVRRGRVVRTTRGRLAVVVPVLESARAWPVDPCQVALNVRASTLSGREVRVLVDLTVLLASQPPGRRYDDARIRLATVAEQRFVAMVADHEATDLAASGRGVVAALVGIAVPGGSITGVDLAGVELLLHLHQPTGGSGRDGNR
ncbi:MAG: hypothetical protein QM572_09350 [Nocardioides sp.]